MYAKYSDLVFICYTCSDAVWVSKDGALCTTERLSAGLHIIKKINISSDFFVLVMISMIHVGKAYQQYSKSTVTGPRGKNHQSVTPLSSSLLYVIDYQWFWFPILNASHSIASPGRLSGNILFSRAFHVCWHQRKFE